MPPVSYDRHISLLKRLRYMLEAATVFLFYGLFAIMPVKMASNTAGRMMRAIGPKLGVSRRAKRHMRFALPDMPEAAVSGHVADMWENLGRVFAEYPHLAKLYDRMEIEGAEHLEAIKNSGKAAILVGGHFANWEAYAIVAARHGIPLHLVYRKPNNIYLEKLLEHARARGGAKGHIPKTVEGARQMMRVLKQGDYLGILLDQKFNEGMAVPFFGHDAMTAPTAFELARRHNCPVHPARIRRVKGARYKVTIYPPLTVSEDSENVAYDMLCDLHKLFEDWIREEPGQWLWLHRRWPQI